MDGNGVAEKTLLERTFQASRQEQFANRMGEISVDQPTMPHEFWRVALAYWRMELSVLRGVAEAFMLKDKIDRAVDEGAAQGQDDFDTIRKMAGLYYSGERR